MTDLGAGVYEVPDEPDEHFAGTQAPRTNGPSCPWCGQHDTSTRVAHPDGEWFCACGSLHNGTDGEWRRLAEHRRIAIERRARQRGYDAE
jgi:hypothetical protein